MAETFVEPIEQFGLNSRDHQHSLFSKIGVVGCGKDGRNIVAIAASAGIEVVFVEVSQERIDYTMQMIGESLDAKIGSWGLTESEKRMIMGRISGALTVDALAGCDFVIEAVRYHDSTGERSSDQRKETFKNLERVLSRDAIIATNASTVDISELAAELEHKERCLCIHFLVTQPEARIIELVKGVFTSDEAYAKVCTFARMIKHDVVDVRESAGLVSIRLFAVLLNEACQMLMENVASVEDIDKVLQKGYGYRLGVFRSADMIGIEKIVALMENLFEEYGDKKYKPAPLLMRLYRAQCLGVSTGKGFYQYDEKGNVIKN